MVLKLTDKETGTVKWFDSRKGFGFIQSSDGTDVFVHYSAIITEDDGYKSLNENDEVEYEVEQGNKGPKANKVIVTKKSQTNKFNDGSGFRI